MYPGGLTEEEFHQRLAQLAAKEKAAVTALGDQIGYGRIMQLCEEIWGEKDGNGGQFRHGPCVAMTVPCGCKIRHKCDWCCGAGWLTAHVKKVKDQLEPAELQPSEFYTDTHYWVKTDNGGWWPMYLNVQWEWKMGNGVFLPHQVFLEMMDGVQIVEAVEPKLSNSDD